MSTTLLDTSTLIDLLEDRPVWGNWASRQIEALASTDRFVINQIVYGEASVPYTPQSDFDDQLDFPWLNKEDLPWDAAFLAAKAHKTYRNKGGLKSTGMPDFFIGAHAAVRGYRLLTRDAARIRTYFPDVEIIAPDTHP
jgi:predicted nucleic acid-binding protein